MKNNLVGLVLGGLIGLNALSIANSLEVYEVPDKSNAKLTDEGFFTYKHKLGFNLLGTYKKYEKPDGTIFFENLIRGKVESYVVEPKNSKKYIILDTNCDGKFETKVDSEETDVPIPECYYNY